MTIPENEPASFAAAIARLTGSHPPGSRLHELGTDLLRSHAVTRERRAAVLKHKDLSDRLVDELGYDKPQQWNGYLPPATMNPGDTGGMCSGAVLDPYGGMRFVFNQVGRRAIGELSNDSHRRKILAEISTEAWWREHPAEEADA
jgi:hypothetical protein